MKKIGLIILFIFSFIASYAQSHSGIYDRPNNKGIGWMRGIFDSSLGVPYASLHDSVKFLSSNKRKGVIAYDTINKRFLYSADGNRYDSIISTGSSGAHSLQDVTDIGYITTNPIYTQTLNVASTNRYPQYMLALGHSFVIGSLSAVPTVQGFAFLYARYKGLRLYNQGVSGSDVYAATKSAYTFFNPGHRIFGEYMFTVNEFRKPGGISTSIIKQTVLNTMMNILDAQLGSAYYYAGNGSNITRTGSWTTSVDATPYAAKANNTAITVTNGDVIKFITSDTLVGISVMGGDGVNTTYSNFQVFVNSISRGVYSANGQVDGLQEGCCGNYDNRRLPFLVLVRNVTIGDTIKVVKLNTAGDTLWINHFSNWENNQNSMPSMFYTTPFYGAADSAAVRLFNAQEDSLIATVSTRPIKIAQSNNFYHYGTNTNVDGLHPNTTGHLELFNAAVNADTFNKRGTALVDVMSTDKPDLAHFGNESKIKTTITNTGGVLASERTISLMNQSVGYGYWTDTIGIDRYACNCIAQKTSYSGDSITEWNSYTQGTEGAVIVWQILFTRYIDKVTTGTTYMSIPGDQKFGGSGNLEQWFGANAVRQHFYKSGSNFADFFTGSNGVTDQVYGYVPSGGTGTTCYLCGSITKPSHWGVNMTNNDYTAFFNITGDESHDVFDIFNSSAVKKISIDANYNISGPNFPIYGNATLSSGTVTVTDSKVTSTSKIIISTKTASGTLGTYTYTLSAGASFTINSSSALDNSVITYSIQY